MIWKSLILFTGSESPVSCFRFFRWLKKRDGDDKRTRHSNSLSLSLSNFSQVVVVLSGSMEPGFHRGDILFLSSAQKGPPLSSGDIVVFNIGGRGKTIKKSWFFFLFRGRTKKNKTHPKIFQNSLLFLSVSDMKKQISRSSTGSSKSTTAASSWPQAAPRA